MQMGRFKIFVHMVTSPISQFVTGCFSGSRLLLKWCRERRAFKTGFLSSCTLHEFYNWCCSALSATLLLSFLCQPVQTMGCHQGTPHRTSPRSPFLQGIPLPWALTWVFELGGRPVTPTARSRSSGVFVSICWGAPELQRAFWTCQASPWDTER